MFVANDRLPYLLVTREQTGPTRVVVRDPSYLVTCSTKRRAGPSALSRGLCKRVPASVGQIGGR